MWDFSGKCGKCGISVGFATFDFRFAISPKLLEKRSWSLVGCQLSAVCARNNNLFFFGFLRAYCVSPFIDKGFLCVLLIGFDWLWIIQVVVSPLGNHERCGWLIDWLSSEMDGLLAAKSQKRRKKESDISGGLMESWIGGIGCGAL